MAEQNLVKESSAGKLLHRFAVQWGVDENKLLASLKATCFKIKDGEVSDSQMMALLVVADQYKLNPFTREIYAFEDKHKGIVPIVGLDGWLRIINGQSELDGIEFRESEEIVTNPGAKPCPKWIECIIHRKDREHPTRITEYLDECYRAPFKRSDGSMYEGPWQTHTKRLLRWKSLIQAARVAFGLVGIYDEDEAHRIIEGSIERVFEDVSVATPEKTRTETVKDVLKARKEQIQKSSEWGYPPEVSTGQPKESTTPVDSKASDDTGG